MNALRQSLSRRVPAVVLALGVATAVALGPLWGRSIGYHVSREATVQYLGGELVTLAAAICVAVAAFLAAGSRLLLMQAGAAAYVLYTIVTVVFGQSYTRYPGTAEAWFVLFVVISTAALFSLADAVSQLLRSPYTLGSRVHRVTVIVIAFLFALLWGSALAGHYGGGASGEYLADPTLFWLVKYLDLAVIVPTALVCGVWWSRTHRVGALVVLSFSVWMTAAITGMQIAMVVLAGAPVGSLAVAGVMASISLWCAYAVIRARVVASE